MNTDRDSDKSQDPYQKNYMESLRNELVEVVRSKLSPLAKSLEYSEEALEKKIKWKPCVLVLGNYSSGKSTFINELLGQDVQRTGQAPTDDAFTVITYDESASELTERDGNTLIGGEEYPFSGLKKYGARLAAHFRHKITSAAPIKGLALIDTPGMLDSVSERDRGYNYQDVIGELAEVSDLIIVMFDPHKAGTIRETYQSLRETLPRVTFEDRVVFALNRVDECDRLSDLLRVYGTLCWNLSQMTGRKDIPHIKLTWAEGLGSPDSQAFLGMLDNQRSDLKAEVGRAPRHHLSHVVTFVEEHAAKLRLFINVLLAYRQKRRRVFIKSVMRGFFSGTFCAALALVGAVVGMGMVLIQNEVWMVAGVAMLLGSGVGMGLSWSLGIKQLDNTSVRNPESLVKLNHERDRDLWKGIRKRVEEFLGDPAKNKGLKNHRLKQDQRSLNYVIDSQISEIRRAIESSP